MFNNQNTKNKSSLQSHESFSQKLRKRVHSQLIDLIDTDGVEFLKDKNAVIERISWLVDELEETSGKVISKEQRKQLQLEILEELGGMGPLAPLMIDDEISDILVNGPDEVWIDKSGVLKKTEVRFDDDAHLRRFLDRLLAKQGRNLDNRNPMVDARLNDGSRLHAVIPPLCSKGAIVSIRRFQSKKLAPADLIEKGFLNQDLLDFLKLIVEAGFNIVISGGASAGKTTLLNMVSSFIPESERIITVEETSELRLQHAHVIPLEGRAANIEGHGEISLRDLVKTALRMRADRIIVGEVRGSEVLDMLQAMNIGHDGSLTTIHANSPEDVLRRLEGLVLMGDMGLPRESIREMISAAVQIVIQVNRLPNGQRRISNIAEVTNKDGLLTTRQLVGYKNYEDGTHAHYFTNDVAQVLKKVEEKGIALEGLKQLLQSGYGENANDH